MTAVTVVTYIEVADPSKEVVNVTATDAYTYLSRKFKTITGCIAVCNTAAVTNAINPTFSGQTVTINCNGLSGANVTLEIYGKHS